jgi:hypothetical protein
MMAAKRRFDRVRELPSGRWQARYRGPDGIERPAPHTFESKTSAERWLTLTEAEIIQGDLRNAYQLTGLMILAGPGGEDIGILRQ